MNQVFDQVKQYVPKLSNADESKHIEVEKTKQVSSKPLSANEFKYIDVEMTKPVSSLASHSDSDYIVKNYTRIRKNESIFIF